MAREQMPKDVRKQFETFAPAVRKRLLSLRKLILHTAQETEGVERLTESLKWGQPSYATQPKTGTPVRIGAHPEADFAMYFHCQTNLVRRFRRKYKKAFRYDGNRALLFSVDDKLDEARLRACIRDALLYYVS